MEMNPQQVRAMSFSTVKRGYDLDEVSSFVDEVATALETAQNETRAMEARARAAVARLQELSQGADAESAAPESRPVAASVDESETISRTLLLAQRTADTTVAEANDEAERILAGARDDAAQSLDKAHELAGQLVEDSKEEARRAGEGERVRVESEVQALSARRDFLEADVDTLESFLIEQRERIRESATVLSELVERVPGGLGAMRPPMLSAANEPPAAESSVATEAGDAGDDEDDTQPHELFPVAGDETDGEATTDPGSTPAGEDRLVDERVDDEHRQ